MDYSKYMGGAGQQGAAAGGQGQSTGDYSQYMDYSKYMSGSGQQGASAGGQGPARRPEEEARGGSRRVVQVPQRPEGGPAQLGHLPVPPARAEASLVPAAPPPSARLVAAAPKAPTHPGGLRRSAEACRGLAARRLAAALKRRTERALATVPPLHTHAHAAGALSPSWRPPWMRSPRSAR